MRILALVLCLALLGLLLDIRGSVNGIQRSKPTMTTATYTKGDRSVTLYMHEGESRQDFRARLDAVIGLAPKEDCWIENGGQVELSVPAEPGESLEEQCDRFDQLVETLRPPEAEDCPE